MNKINITEARIDNAVKKTLNNFLKEYRQGTRNNAKLVSINENDIKRMIASHSDSGYIVISPCRGGDDFGINPKASQAEANQLAQINKERVREIIKDIKASGFSYTPTYGGFIENKGTDKETTVYERSFIVYNKDREGKTGDFRELYEFGLEMCKKYNQDSFLIQAPGEKPKYITQDGTVDMEFNGGKVFNDVSQTYFTDLHKNTHKKGDINNRKPTRFSFTEAYVNPKPQCYSERHARWMNNEIF